MLQGVNVIEFVVLLIVYICLLVVCLVVEEVCDVVFVVLYIMLNMGMIKGGIVINVVFCDCEFIFDFCYFLGIDLDWFFGEVECYVQQMLLF